MRIAAKMDKDRMVVAVSRGGDGEIPIASFTFDVAAAFASLSEVDRKYAVALVAMDDALFSAVLDRLASESECWVGTDGLSREAWLLKIGAVHEERVKAAEEYASRTHAEALEIKSHCRDVAEGLRNHAPDLPPCCVRAVAALNDAGWGGKVLPPPHAPDAKEGTP